MARGGSGTSATQLRALEFYAGVGGFHYALRRSGLNAAVVGSVDINTTANEVYRHNFPNTVHLNRNICGMTADELDGLAPDLVHMSPPCQPFTRQGLRRDYRDRRTDSFFHLMHIIAEMRTPPTYVLMENVQGFESSHTRNEFTGILTNAGYTYQEFLLSPKQFGIPNSRLRYYLLAKKRPLDFLQKFEEQPTKDAIGLEECVTALKMPPHLQTLTLSSSVLHCSTHSTVTLSSSSIPLSSPPPPYKPPSSPTSNLPSSSSLPSAPASSSMDQHAYSSPSTLPPLPTLSTFLLPLSNDALKPLFISADVLKKYAPALDIVSPMSTHSCCFTRGYGNYAVGTGSVLQHETSEDFHRAFRAFTEKKKAGVLDEAVQHLIPLGLRYFAPREVANLMCFPLDFSIPSTVTVRQSYKVLGNSLNVLVVSVLLKYLVLESQ